MALYCAHCGKRVKRTNGFFRSWPDPVALHHHCVNKHFALRAAHAYAAEANGR